MKNPNENPEEFMPSTPEGRDNFALEGTRRLLAGDTPFPNPVPACALYFAIGMAVELSPTFTPALAVETVVAASTPTELQPLRNGLLKYYAFTGDNANAARFLPKRGKETVCEYQPAMQVYLASGDMKMAKAISVLCGRRIPANGAADAQVDEFIKFGLHMALAAYHARVGKYREATKFWGMSGPGDPFFADAVTALPYSLIVQTLSTIRRGVNELLNQPMHDTFGFKAVSVLDPLGRTPRAAAALEGLRADLVRILPEEQRRSFGVSDDGRTKDVDRREGR